MRSNGKVNVAQLAVKYKGGGHERAAGATMEGSSKEIIAELCQDAEAQIFGESGND